MKRLTQKEFELIERHLLQDISYDNGGTFYKDSNTDEADYKEMELAKKILVKIKDILVKNL